MKSVPLIPLGRSGWSMWRDVLVRGTGFPVSGLARFANPDAAAAADDLADGVVSVDVFDKAFTEAVLAGADALSRIAADPLLREAVSWQNPGVLPSLDALVRGGALAPRNEKRRSREKTLLRYWQRYCGKNDTIGFFGPICWAQLTDDTRVQPGEGMLRRRGVFFEFWALDAFARTLEEQLEVRQWLRPTVRPHLTITGDAVLFPTRPPVAVSSQDRALLRQCTGERRARDVVEALVADGTLRSTQDGYLRLDHWAGRDVLRWGAQLPLQPGAEDVLRQQLGEIDAVEIRQEQLARLRRLTDARHAVAAAAGDPDALRAALAALDDEFTAITGQAPRRRAGQTYGGRTLCYEETVRDVSVSLSTDVFDAVAEPLAVLLQIARWLTRAIGSAALTLLRDLYDELAGAGGTVSFAELWYLAQGSLFHPEDGPVAGASAELVRRCGQLFGTDSAPAGTSRLDLDVARLVEQVHTVFPAGAPAFSTGRVHSPDLQICAPSVDAIRDGDFLMVLGELHAAWASCDSAVFTFGHDDPQALVAACARDIGEYRLRPLHPDDWPGYTARVAEVLDGPTDFALAFTDAPHAPGVPVLPITALTVGPGPDETLQVRAPDGRRWPLLEGFAALLSLRAVNAFKLVGAAAHTPRVTAGRLVLVRETWRTTVADTGLAEVVGERARYLAARRWRRELGLPELVFAKVGTEPKPCYVDFTSPQSVFSLVGMMREASLNHPGVDRIEVVVTEMLPTPDDAWLPDATGERYFSEIRMHVVDPEPEAGA